MRDAIKKFIDDEFKELLKDNPSIHQKQWFPFHVDQKKLREKFPDLTESEENIRGIEYGNPGNPARDWTFMRVLLNSNNF